MEFPVASKFLFLTLIPPGQCTQGPCIRGPVLPRIFELLHRWQGRWDPWPPGYVLQATGLGRVPLGWC